jgi:hypothetical protein
MLNMADPVSPLPMCEQSDLRIQRSRNLLNLDRDLVLTQVMKLLTGDLFGCGDHPKLFDSGPYLFIFRPNQTNAFQVCWKEACALRACSLERIVAEIEIARGSITMIASQT